MWLEQFAEKALNPKPLVESVQFDSLPSGHVIFHQSHTRTDPRDFWPSGNMIADATSMTLVSKLVENLPEGHTGQGMIKVH